MYSRANDVAGSWLVVPRADAERIGMRIDGLSINTYVSPRQRVVVAGTVIDLPRGAFLALDEDDATTFVDSFIIAHGCRPVVEDRDFRAAPFRRTWTRLDIARVESEPIRL